MSVGLSLGWPEGEVLLEGCSDGFMLGSELVDGSLLVSSEGWLDLLGLPDGTELGV